MKFIATENPLAIEAMRQQLYQRFTAPLDGMWESLYIAGSQDFRIDHGQEDIGYCCIDATGSLTQIFLKAGHNHQMAAVIDALIETKQVQAAKLSSIEPVAFNACLARAQAVKPDTYCYQYSPAQDSALDTVDLALALPRDAEDIRNFYRTHVGFDDNFGYTDNLVQRKALYLLWEAGQIKATGECRPSDSQPRYADVGMAVNTAFRKQGLGAQVLYQLTKKAREANRIPICSTTVDNIASQKAIQKAGFYCAHIIFELQFSTSKQAQV